MLGLTIGTMGVGAAASATARLAVTARSAGALARAGRFATLSKAFTYTNLGAGSFMFGYMGAGTWELYKQYRLGNAHFRDVMLSAGMALFPVVHMSVSGVSAYRARTAAARAGQMLPADPEFDPSPGRFKPAEAPGFDSPEGIFGFMQRLASQNPLAVAQFGRLPAPARSALVSWMSKQGPVRMALETGSPNDLAIRSIRGGMDGLQPVTRPQADISLLTDRAQLAALLRDILSTGKTPSELSQKNAAHATLERIRASNPDAARYIDRLVNDGGYAGLRSDLLSGRPLSQKSVTILQNNSVLIGAELPEGMRPLAMAANEGIRASVGDESSKPPPRVGGVTPARESAPAGIESKASEEKLAPEEMQPAVRRELTHAEQEMFVDNPKQLMKGVFGEETSLEDIAMHDIDDPEWLEPKPDHVEMLQTRSVVLEKMRGYFNEAAKGMNWSEEAIKRYGDAFISLLDVSERNGYTTYGHTMRVAEYTNKTLERMDIPVEEKAKIRLAALIHDVGKIGVKNEILRLPRKTTLAEREIVGKHAGFSEVVANGIFAKIGLVDAKGFKEISEIAKYHQEYFDGTKYFQKKGTDIPLGARIIALADAYDAMTSIRSYNKVPNAQDKAIGIIQNGGGTQFDPELVPIFIEAITSK